MDNVDVSLDVRDRTEDFQGLLKESCRSLRYVQVVALLDVARRMVCVVNDLVFRDWPAEWGLGYVGGCWIVVDLK